MGDESKRGPVTFKQAGNGCYHVKRKGVIVGVLLRLDTKLWKAELDDEVITTEMPSAKEAMAEVRKANGQVGKAPSNRKPWVGQIRAI